ncbi:hypothetical protein B5180_30420 [Streptomyces sp. BF-3]|nr:hypothetical protein B5180_30420 [Streptomyces sp. BF-3]
MTFRFTAQLACGLDDPEEDDCTLDPAALADPGLVDTVVEAQLRAPAADVARLREVLPRILAYGRPDAHPRFITT